jgi:hypothetical protein
MPNVGRAFADRASAKMVRVFQRLADPCLFTSSDGSVPYTRLVSLDDNGSEIAASSNEFIPELISRAEFLLSEGMVSPGDEFSLGEAPNVQLGRLTQRVSMDSVCVTFIYVPL